MMALSNAEQKTVPAKAHNLRIKSITVITCTANVAHNHATLCGVLDDGPVCTYEGVGTGPIDAMCRALGHFEQGFVVSRWKGGSSNEGSDAVAYIDVTIRCTDGKIYHGQGSHRNTLQATAEAIADALNKHFCFLHKYPRRS